MSKYLVIDYWCQYEADAVGYFDDLHEALQSFNDLKKSKTFGTVKLVEVLLETTADLERVRSSVDQ